MSQENLEAIRPRRRLGLAVRAFARLAPPPDRHHRAPLRVGAFWLSTIKDK